MRNLLFFGFGMALALSFVGADCGSVTPPTRSCPGSATATLYYRASGNCGAAGVTGIISASVTSANSCVLSIDEPSTIGLPSAGAFAPAAGPGYVLADGNWALNTQNTQGPMATGTFLNCSSAAASATGDITLSCEQEVCAIGDSDDVSCSTGTACTTHLTPVAGDASVGVIGTDAGPSIDATMKAVDGG